MYNMSINKKKKKKTAFWFWCFESNWNNITRAFFVFVVFLSSSNRTSNNEFCFFHLYDSMLMLMLLLLLFGRLSVGSWNCSNLFCLLLQSPMYCIVLHCIALHCIYLVNHFIVSKYFHDQQTVFRSWVLDWIDFNWCISSKQSNSHNIESSSIWFNHKYIFLMGNIEFLMTFILSIIFVSWVLSNSQ